MRGDWSVLILIDLIVCGVVWCGMKCNILAEPVSVTDGRLGDNHCPSDPGLPGLRHFSSSKWLNWMLDYLRADKQFLSQCFLSTVGTFKSHSVSLPCVGQTFPPATRTPDLEDQLKNILIVSLNDYQKIFNGKLEIFPNNPDCYWASVPAESRINSCLPEWLTDWPRPSFKTYYCPSQS